MLVAGEDEEKEGHVSSTEKGQLRIYGDLNHLDMESEKTKAFEEWLQTSHWEGNKLQGVPQKYINTLNSY